MLTSCYSFVMHMLGGHMGAWKNDAMHDADSIRHARGGDQFVGRYAGTAPH